MNNFWKFFCWMYAVFSVPTAIAEIANIAKWRLVDYLFIPSLVLGFIMLYSYAYKVRVFPQKIWKIFWWYNIIWTVITLLSYSPPFDKYYPEFLKGYYAFEPQPAYDSGLFSVIVLVCIAVAGLLYYANFVLAFDKKYLSSQKDKN